uniref:Uncharacterized protein n=1 Tax=Setaria viridis TaxID=4556 RepID=A0A4U6TG28_SETVI|nr:hypothetical protein SEVIR_8G168250v2 [Setaria viridis]
MLEEMTGTEMDRRIQTKLCKKKKMLVSKLRSETEWRDGVRGLSAFPACYTCSSPKTTIHDIKCLLLEKVIGLDKYSMCSLVWLIMLYLYLVFVAISC